MGLGKLLRGAADYADKATAAVTEAAGDALSVAKEKANDLRGMSGNEEQVYDSALTAVGDAIADSGHMTSDIMAILQTIRDGNPYKG